MSKLNNMSKQEPPLPEIWGDLTEVNWEPLLEPWDNLSLPDWDNIQIPSWEDIKLPIWEDTLPDWGALDPSPWDNLPTYWEGV